MRINESTIRRIIREEARRVLSEGSYMMMSLKRLIDTLRDAGEDRIADRFSGGRHSRHMHDPVELDVRHDLDLVKVYWVGSSNFIDEIPLNVAKNAGLV